MSRISVFTSIHSVTLFVVLQINWANTGRTMLDFSVMCHCYNALTVTTVNCCFMQLKQDLLAL